MKTYLLLFFGLLLLFLLSTQSFAANTTYCTNDQQYHSSFLVTGLPTGINIDVVLEPQGGGTPSVLNVTTSSTSMWFTYSSFSPTPKISEVYGLEIWDIANYLNLISGSCEIEFKNTIKLKNNRCDQTFDYHSDVNHELTSSLANKYNKFRYHIYSDEDLTEYQGYFEYEQGGGVPQPRFSDLTLGSNPDYLQIDVPYWITTEVQDIHNEWSNESTSACKVTFNNSIKLRNSQCDVNDLDYHEVLLTNLNTSNFARYGGVKFKFYKNDGNVLGDYVGSLTQDYGGSAIYYSSVLTTTGGNSTYLSINESYLVTTTMKDKNGNWSNESSSACSIDFENHIKLHSTQCGNQTIDCEQSLQVDLASSIRNRYKGFRFHFYEDLGAGNYEYVGYLQDLVGGIANKYSDPLYGGCQPFLELNTDYKVETTALDNYSFESEFNDGNSCDPVAISTCNISNSERCRIATSLKTDTDAPYWCSGNVTLSLEGWLPNNATNVSYTCYWNGSTVAEGNTKTVSSATSVEVTGRVAYDLDGTTYNCHLDPKSINIIDGNSTNGQEYIPAYYWTFEEPNAYAETIDGNTFITNNKDEDLIELKKMEFYTGNAGVLSTTSGGQVGAYLHFDHEAQKQAKFTYEHSKTRQFSMEFIMRFDEDYVSGYTLRRVNGSNSMSAVATLRHNLFSLLASYYGYKECVITGKTASKSIPLTGINRKSWNHYDDAEWHHFAVTADLEQGLIKLYADGHSPPDFQFYFETNPDDYFELQQISSQLIGNDFFQNIFGDIDEIALYEGQVLQATIVAQHYKNMLNGEHYTFIDNQAYCNISGLGDLDVTGEYDERDFPIGYDPNLDGLNASNISKPIDQYSRAPYPRYLPKHSLRRNYPWWAYQFMGGYPGFASTQSWQVNADETNQELALNWHYLANALGEGNAVAKPLMQDFSSSHPEIPTYHTMFWPNLKPTKYGLPSNHGPMQVQSNLSPDHYLKDDNGAQTTAWDPTSTASQVAIEMDGYAQYLKLESLLEGSKTPISIFNENGEIYPAVGLWNTSFNNSYNSSLQTEYTTYQNGYQNTGWTTGYAPYLKTKLRKQYRDAFLNGTPLLSANNPEFSYYSVDGKGGHHAGIGQVSNWEAIREIQLNMGSNHYSTPDFYPVYMDNWDGIRGDKHGLRWINECRRIEQNPINGTVDKLFSPFVASGWAANPIYNYRPGRWLGLLKVLGVYGAEFYYTGYFTLTEGNNLPLNDSRHWAWQAICPAYAQAITSRYETILRDGELMEVSVNDYRLLSGSQDIYTVARKWIDNNNDPQYIISTTLQPRTNQIPVSGQPELERLATIKDFDNQSNFDLQLMSRRQGNTFLFKKDEQGQGEPVMIWLDHWHEPWHFDHWDQDYVFEAEVPDEVQQITPNIAANEYMSVRTRTYDNNGNELTPTSLTEDYTDFISFYTFPNFVGNTYTDWDITAIHPKLSYRFRVVDDEASTESYTLYVKARLKSGTTVSNPVTGINVVLRSEEQSGQVESDYIGCINSTAWKWYSYGICEVIEFNELAEGIYLLDLIPDNELLEIDQIILDKDGDRVFPQGEVFASACNNQPMNIDAAVSWNTPCEGPVSIAVTTLPSFDPSCNEESIEYKWIHKYKTSSTSLWQTATVYPKDVPSASYIGGGTYANPTFDFAYENELELTIYIGGIVKNVVTHTGIMGLSAPIVNASSSHATICKGQEATLTANTSGGNAPYSYFWFPSLTTLQSNQAVTTVLPNEVGNNDFEISVMDANGCKASDIVSLDVTESLDASITGNIINCYGYNQAVNLTSSVIGGNGSYSYTWSPTTNLNCNPCNSSSVTVNQPIIQQALYKLKVTDGNGCVGSAHQLIHVEDQLLATITPSEELSAICANQTNSPILNGSHVSTTPPYSHLWAFPGNSTGTTQTLTQSTAGDYLYTYEVTDNNGCKSIAYQSVTFKNCASNRLHSPEHKYEEEVSEEVSTIIYPNPSMGQLNLKFGRGESGNIKVYDVQSKLVFETTFIEKQQFRLGLEHLVNGLYLINIQTKQKNKVYKLTIQH